MSKSIGWMNSTHFYSRKLINIEVRFKKIQKKLFWNIFSKKFKNIFETFVLEKNLKKKILKNRQEFR